MHINLFKPLLLIVITLMGFLAYAQENTHNTRVVYPSFGFGIGFFYPKDVNDYIEASLPAGYVTEYGFNALIMYLDLHAGVTFRMRRFDISGILEYDIAPKLIVITNGDNLSFAYHRISPGISANYYIPVATGRHAFFIGGSVNYNFMLFEEFNASSPGFRLHAGYSIQLSKFNIQPFGAFSYAKATDSSQDNWSNFVLDYTGGQFGVNLSFHPQINYK